MLRNHEKMLQRQNIRTSIGRIRVWMIWLKNLSDKSKSGSVVEWSSPPQQSTLLRDPQPCTWWLIEDPWFVKCCFVEHQLMPILTELQSHIAVNKYTDFALIMFIQIPEIFCKFLLDIGHPSWSEKVISFKKSKTFEELIPRGLILRSQVRDLFLPHPLFLFNRDAWSRPK